jgi:hypothetical protein
MGRSVFVLIVVNGGEQLIREILTMIVGNAHGFVKYGTLSGL